MECIQCRSKRKKWEEKGVSILYDDRALLLIPMITLQGRDLYRRLFHLIFPKLFILSFFLSFPSKVRKGAQWQIY